MTTPWGKPFRPSVASAARAGARVAFAGPTRPGPPGRFSPICWHHIRFDLLHPGDRTFRGRGTWAARWACLSQGSPLESAGREGLGVFGTSDDGEPRALSVHTRAVRLRRPRTRGVAHCRSRAAVRAHGLTDGPCLSRWTDGPWSPAKWTRGSRPFYWPAPVVDTVVGGAVGGGAVVGGAVVGGVVVGGVVVGGVVFGGVVFGGVVFGGGGNGGKGVSTGELEPGRMNGVPKVGVNGLPSTRDGGERGASALPPGATKAVRVGVTTDGDRLGGAVRGGGPVKLARGDGVSKPKMEEPAGGAGPACQIATAVATETTMTTASPTFSPTSSRLRIRTTISAWSSRGRFRYQRRCSRRRCAPRALCPNTTRCWTRHSRHRGGGNGRSPVVSGPSACARCSKPRWSARQGRPCPAVGRRDSTRLAGLPRALLGLRVAGLTDPWRLP